MYGSNFVKRFQGISNITKCVEPNSEDDINLESSDLEDDTTDF